MTATIITTTPRYHDAPRKTTIPCPACRRLIPRILVHTNGNRRTDRPPSSFAFPIYRWDGVTTIDDLVLPIFATEHEIVHVRHTNNVPTRWQLACPSCSTFFRAGAIGYKWGQRQNPSLYFGTSGLILVLEPEFQHWRRRTGAR